MWIREVPFFSEASLNFYSRRDELTTVDCELDFSISPFPCPIFVFVDEEINWRLLKRSLIYIFTLYVYIKVYKNVTNKM